MSIHAFTEERLDTARGNINLALKDLGDFAKVMKEWRHDYPFLSDYADRVFLKTSRELNAALEAIGRQ